MVAPRFARCRSGLHFLFLAAMLLSGPACVAPGDGSGSNVVRAIAWGPRGGGSRDVDEEIRLPAAEQMIDELDRIMTANGTIGVKSPDVWGQDRLAKFRSEYETQMAEWLKAGFKSEFNATIRRSENEARRLQVGAGLAEGPASPPASITVAATTPAAAHLLRPRAHPQPLRPARKQRPDQPTRASSPSSRRSFWTSIPTTSITSINCGGSTRGTT